MLDMAGCGQVQSLTQTAAAVPVPVLARGETNRAQTVPAPYNTPNCRGGSLCGGTARC